MTLFDGFEEPARATCHRAIVLIHVLLTFGPVRRVYCSFLARHSITTGLVHKSILHGSLPSFSLRAE